MSAAVGLIVIFIIGVLLNGFFAGYETGFVSCNPLRVRHLAEEKKNWTARQLLHALEHPNHMLTGVLIGTNISLLLGTIALTRQFGDVWTPIIATPLVLVFGELLPKSMFRIHPTRLSLLLLPPMRFFLSIFAPLSAPTLWITRHLLRGIYGQEANSMPLLMRSPEDVRILVDESADKGAIDKEEKEMIHASWISKPASPKKLWCRVSTFKPCPTQPHGPSLLRSFRRAAGHAFHLSRDH